MTPTTHSPEVQEAGHAKGAGIPAALLVSAIAVLVIVVSMPRFRAHVLDANREDARLTIALLGSAVFNNKLPEGLPLTSGKSTPAGGLEEAAEGHEPGLFEFVRDVKRLRHRFPDARATGTAGELLHHGYRFATGYVHKDLARHEVLVAWPDSYGKSGDVAFAAMEDGSIYGHPNHGLWSGEESSVHPDQAVQPSGSAASVPGDSQALFHVDLSDESWVLVRSPD